MPSLLFIVCGEAYVHARSERASETVPEGKPILGNPLRETILLLFLAWNDEIRLVLQLFL